MFTFQTLRERVSVHTPADTHQQAEQPPASTCRQCGAEIRQHQMHDALLISMPTNLTQSKKVTLCGNKKKASLFQNCMLGSLQADGFNERDSLKRSALHLWRTACCSRQNCKTILISDHFNGWDAVGGKAAVWFSCQTSQRCSRSAPDGLNLPSAAPHASRTANPLCVCASQPGIKGVGGGDGGSFWCVLLAPGWVGVTPTALMS